MLMHEALQYAYRLFYTLIWSQHLFNLVHAWEGFMMVYVETNMKILPLISTCREWGSLIPKHQWHTYATNGQIGDNLYVLVVCTAIYTRPQNTH